MEEEVRFLPSEIVYSILDVLGQYGYAGFVSFSQYNEPLEDPRLYAFIEYAGGICPKAKVYVVTNGNFLNRGTVAALCELGVDHVIVSLYGNKQEIRKQQIEAFAGDLQIGFYYGGLDDRLEIYDRSEVNWFRPCTAPLGQVVVTRDAEVGLCCMDWGRQYTFGSLHEDTLDDILCRDGVRETYRRLVRGDRFLDICKRCTTGRQ